MTTEDYVSFETSKLLKEKGFDVPCNCYGAYNGVNLTYRLCITDKYTNWNKHSDKFIISCPTLQMVMKWLREVHKIYIDTNIRIILEQWAGYDINIYATNANDCLLGKIISLKDLKDNTSYEQACEAAIKYCLEHLI